jgi:hypothetical protein
MNRSQREIETGTDYWRTTGQQRGRWGASDNSRIPPRASARQVIDSQPANSNTGWKSLDEM